jgi:hypothetical protein
LIFRSILLWVICGVISSSNAQPGNFFHRKIPFENAEAFLIGMMFKPAVVGFTVTPEEALDYNESLLSPVSDCIDKECVLVGVNDLQTIRKFNVPVIVASLVSYRVGSSLMGQKVGEITIMVHFFKTPQDQKPYKSLRITAVGDRDWGNSMPLENAVEKLEDEIDDACDN